MNIGNVMKMKVKDLREFTFENYHKRIGFTKEDSYHSLKRKKKKDLVLFATNLTKEMLIKLEDSMNYFSKKTKLKDFSKHQKL